jgi:nucleotide-binding universal stress UspA family protein
VESPVLTLLHDAEHAQSVAAPEVWQVACAVNLGPESGGVLEWASGFAATLRAKLSILHASPQLEPVIGVVHDPEWRASLGAVLLDQIEKLKAQTGVSGEVHIAGGEPARTVAELADEVRADVLVIGRPAPDRLLGRLRTHSYAIIQQARCPVVSV